MEICKVLKLLSFILLFSQLLSCKEESNISEFNEKFDTHNWLVRNSSFTQCVITRNQTNSGSEFHWEIMIILDSSISLHLIAADKLYNGIFQKKCLLLQQLQLLLRKGKQWFIHWMVEILKNQKLKQGIFLQAPVFQSIFLKKSQNKIIFHENFKITISFWGLVLCIWF